MSVEMNKKQISGTEIARMTIAFLIGGIAVVLPSALGQVGLSVVAVLIALNGR